MSLNRLKRQDFHSCICTAALFVLWTAVFLAAGSSVRETAVFLAAAAAAGIVTGAFHAVIFTGRELAVRLFGTGTLAFAAAAVISGPLAGTASRYAGVVLAGGIWIVAVKLWLRREFCPGWTLLVYDGTDNLAKAERFAQSRRDLILETGRVPGADLDEIARMVEIYRIPQMVICLESGKKELLEYCQKSGITAFVSGKSGKKGCRIGRDGLYYVRPVPPAWKTAFYGKNGALEE